MTGKRAPKGLEPPGRALWRSVLAVYDLSPGELEILRQASRQTDLIARLDEALAAAEVVVVGSVKQPKVNPLVAAVAEARRTLDGLIRSLALPMPGEAAGRRRSPQQAEAAQARWRAQRESHG